MLEIVVTILIFIAVIAIAAVLFGGWLIVATCRLVMRMLSAPFHTPHQPQLIEAPSLSSATTHCANDRCRVENPSVASFCRRCGSPLRAVERVPVRRVAMW